MTKTTLDNTTNPAYYRPEGVYFHCIDLVEQFTFNVGNMLKYMFRLHLKDNAHDNVNKAVWYAKRAMKRGETFTPISPTPTTDTTDMFDALGAIDWQGIEDFWDTMAGVIRHENTPEDILNLLETISDTINK